MAKKKSAKSAAPKRTAKKAAPVKKKKRQVEQYDHPEADRLNNPPVGLVTPETEPIQSAKRTYQYDPHLDPQLVWAGKAEHTSFEVPTVSLHVHERIDPRTIIEAVRSNGEPGGLSPRTHQRGLFDDPEEQLPRREAIEFYKHKGGWSNRLVAGDSLLVMNSLLEKEGMAGRVQMIYIDPPYGIRYGSNFQPFVGQRDVKDRKDQDLTAEPEMLRAFRDTWELGIHSYLTYLRDRLLLARELLHESGSVFVQINDDNLHHLREVCDEVFGAENLSSVVVIKKASPLGSAGLTGAVDFLLWYAKNKPTMKFRQLFQTRELSDDRYYSFAELPDGTRRSLTREEANDLNLVPPRSRLFTSSVLLSSGLTPSCVFDVDFDERTFKPSSGRSWRTNSSGMERLRIAERLLATGNTLRYLSFHDDFKYESMFNLWSDTGGGAVVGKKVYVVQTADKVIQRCMLMTTDPGDLVLDPTCGSGTTAYVAEQWGRRWITCDTSRVAVTLAKQRLMTSAFDYYELAHPEEGIASGFVYKTVPHVTLKSIANNPEIKPGMSRMEIDAAIARYADQETLYDQPKVDRSKVRVTGPFTVEAVPAVTIEPIDGPSPGMPSPQPSPGVPGEGAMPADTSVARSGATARQEDWRAELLQTGVRGKGGAHIEFARLEPLPALRFLHAVGETKAAEPQRVVVSFGPEHAPLEQRHVDQALDEAEKLRPKPDLVLFAAFHFDPEAAKDIDETVWPGVEVHKVQMNADLLTDDLKKKKSSNESFWLIGQPDVEVEKIAKGEDAGKHRVTVHGFDYYNPATGTVDSGGTEKIALWLLDTDYDGRSLYPRQVFFVLSPGSDQLKRLAKTLKAEIDEELIESYYGTQSLPFEAGEYKRVAVKIVDDRGIESLKIVNLV